MCLLESSCFSLNKLFLNDSVMVHKCLMRRRLTISVKNLQGDQICITEIHEIKKSTEMPVNKWAAIVRIPLHLLALKDHQLQNPLLSHWQLFQLPVNNICSILSSTVFFFSDQQMDEIQSN